MNKTLNTIGLAYKAGEIIVSIDNIKNALTKRRVYVVFVSSLSDNSMKELEMLKETYGFEINHAFSSEELSKAVGLNNVKALGLTSKGFYELIK